MTDSADPTNASAADTPPRSDLAGWSRAPFSAVGLSYDCFEKGSGPGVVLIPEIPGITPEVLALADHLVSSGFTVVVPSLFGTPGGPSNGAAIARVIGRLCVAAEFRAFALDARRPITAYLRAVAADLASRTPGPGVGVIGMCFTGGFALATAVDDVVLAPVLSQPAVPFPVGRARQIDPGLSTAELDRIAARTTSDNLCVLGLRFSEDSSSPRGRFDTLSARLGDAFEVIELDSSAGNSAGFPKTAHSVLTTEMRETPGHPTLAARQRVVEFLTERLSEPHR
ncbi:dienelactone hydrolase family protein [Glaciibacter psychrotolerans]|uniref:Dienelactone hydrolase n=1 Tax=Glaciibacter psychrotolerans TaxID=670054 RepID=A0A7Z0EH96_9MICO|nr:dienelactone hydrolase family protein [Leifsonia psychrotolerans]NYJ20882.1 dienelactone hydrolase [Leifsonia psychrotolerans]